jgi:mannose-1-phosphate guanylyltransferase
MNPSTINTFKQGIQGMAPSSATRAAPTGQSWAIVLAAGSGTRLSSLTRDTTGAAVPKQFCSLDGAQSLIEQTLTRASRVIDPQRITAVVADRHRRYWEPALKELPPDNIVIQPQNRGTAIGILLPALRVAARDPDARILILPSDHHVGDEAVLENAMRSALEDIREHPAGVALLGIEADEPDPELGYIVSRAGSHPRLRQVHRFIEKPPVDEARRLVSEGALWNSFIVVCRVQSLIALLSRAYPDVVRALWAIEPQDEATLQRTYHDLPVIDFSRHIATGQEHRLAVMAVAGCGWTDLGTPHRLAQTLARRPRPSTGHAQTARGALGSWINLADRLAQAYPARCGCVTQVSCESVGRDLA